MTKIALLLSAVLTFIILAVPVVASPAGPRVPPDEAAIILKEGNGRYTDGKLRHPHQDRERRALTAVRGQHPLAVILTCSDSQVPPEIIFDQGIGDLFVVRVAGNVAATTQIGSIEYSIDHLATPLVVVLGHNNCGAVAAVMDDTELPLNLAALAEPIRPAVNKAFENNPEAAKDVILNAAIKGNIWQAVADMLQQSPLIREKVREGQLRVIGALYEIDSGKVLWLGPHPEQDSLVGAKKGFSKPAKNVRKSEKVEEGE